MKNKGYCNKSRSKGENIILTDYVKLFWAAVNNKDTVVIRRDFPQKNKWKERMKQTSSGQLKWFSKTRWKFDKHAHYSGWHSKLSWVWDSMCRGTKLLWPSVVWCTGHDPVALACTWVVGFMLSETPRSYSAPRSWTYDNAYTRTVVDSLAKRRREARPGIYVGGEL